MQGWGHSQIKEWWTILFRSTRVNPKNKRMVNDPFPGNQIFALLTVAPTSNWSLILVCNPRNFLPEIAVVKLGNYAGTDRGRCTQNSGIGAELELVSISRRWDIWSQKINSIQGGEHNIFSSTTHELKDSTNLMKTKSWFIIRQKVVVLFPTYKQAITISKTVLNSVWCSWQLRKQTYNTGIPVYLIGNT